MRTSGSNLRFHCLILPLLLMAAVMFAAEKRKAPEPHATIIGTVFQGNGFALPAAEVTLTSVPDADSKEKIKKQTFICNQRGEFVFDVPPVPMHYNVSAKAKGFSSEQKTVEVHGEERVDVTLSLEQESKK